jgi:WhiB family transcriptional regulator, redox-sensing transcriptional regulator
MSIIAAQNRLNPLGPACADLSVELFFPADGERRESWEAREQLALKLCVACPIRTQCLEDALKFPAAEQHGVAGGETAERRRAIIASRRKAARRKFVSAGQDTHTSTSAQTRNRTDGQSERAA